MVSAVIAPYVPSDIASPDDAARERVLGLRDLRYFLSAAMTGNVGRAARELNVSQSAISKQIRKLEEGLGKPLLLRHGRGVTPTPAGARLRDRLRTVMTILAAPLDEAEADALPDTISLGVSPETSGPFVVPLINSTRLLWPRLTFEVREGSVADLTEWITHRHIDVAVLDDAPLLSELEVMPITTDAIGLVGPVHSRVATDPRPLPLRDLSGEPLILPGGQHWLRRRLDQAALQRGVRLTPILQIDSASLCKTMVRNGLGYTILPVSTVQCEIAQGMLAFRPLAQPSLMCTRSVTRHRATSSTPVVAFAERVHETIRALARERAGPKTQIAA